MVSSFIPSAHLTSTKARTRELAEFNFACAQLLKLLGSTSTSIHVQQVDVYESQLVENAYLKKKSSMPLSRELWVFHGTDTKNIGPIMSGGLKVGGQDTGIRVANGSYHGKGVYTATSPKTPMQFARSGNKRLILAKALEGVKGTRDTSDCWAPQQDWLVFKTGDQLLPKYVVIWT